MTASRTLAGSSCAEALPNTKRKAIAHRPDPALGGAGVLFPGCRHQEGAIAAGLLGDIEALIGAFDHVLHVTVAFRVDCKADRDRRRNARLAVADRGLLDRSPDSLREQQCGLLVDLAQQHHELLAA